MAKDKQTIGSKDVGDVSKVMNLNATPAPEGWETEVTGFPPYWQAEPGATFKGRVVAFDPDDENDGAFPRFTLIASGPITCYRGPKDDQTQIVVQQNEPFNVSQWAALPLENYMGFEVWVMAKAQRPIAGGKTVWDFDLRVAPDTKRLVAERQAKLLAEANAAIPTS